MSSAGQTESQTRGGVRWLSTRSVAVIAAAASLTAATASITALAQPTVTRKATVVKIVRRHPFGRMLATIHGRSLYIKPTGTCGPMCRAIWPPLLMPRGKTIPLGARCLETAKLHRRLQVTYRDKRLYLFTGDSGSSVNGNNVGGFKVAKIRTTACP
jgi:hypothetical protein